VEWEFDRIVGLAVSASARDSLPKKDEAQFAAIFEDPSAVWGDHETKRHGTQPFHMRISRVSALRES
jgi:hypothetical protein